MERLHFELTLYIKIPSLTTQTGGRNISTRKERLFL
jgi:hypothetical protein